MAVEIIGGTSGVELDVNTLHKAARAAIYPTQVVGSYAMGARSGTIAAGASAASEVAQFYWTSTSYNAVVKRVRISMGSLGTGFTAGVGTFVLRQARGATVAPSGGTALTITGNNGKRRADQATTVVGAIRIPTTAALTAGTTTLDAHHIGSLSATISTAANTVFVADSDLYRCQPGDYPLVLVAAESLVVQATVPATGTWDVAVTFEWDEVSTSAF
jgi:hypothetical protein